MTIETKTIDLVSGLCRISKHINGLYKTLLVLSQNNFLFCDVKFIHKKRCVMKKILIFSIIVFSCCNILTAGNMKFKRALFPKKISLGDTNSIRVEYENINAMYSVSGIKYKLSISPIDQPNVLYTKEVEGDDLEPEQTQNVDFGPLNFAGFTVGGKYKMTFNTSQIFDEDPTNNLGYHEFEITSEFDRIFAINKLREYLYSNYNENELENTQSYLGMNVLPAGTEISTFGGDEYSEILENDAWFFYTNWDIFSMHEKQVSYMILEENNPEIIQFDVSWFPKINGEVWHPEINDSEQLAFGTIQEKIPDPTFEIDFNLQTPEKKKDSVCVLLVSGYPADLSEQNAFIRSLKLMRWYLQKNELGKQLGDENITELENASAYEIQQFIANAKDHCTEIYIYYIGHATKDGRLTTNDPEEEWMSYPDLFEGLNETNAEEITVVIDACYSGQAISAANNVNKNPNTNVRIYTSSDAELQSKFLWWNNPDKPGTISGAGFFTKQLVISSLDTNANKNKDTLISIEEAFDNMRSTNPRHSILKSNINELQNPQKGEILKTVDQNASILKELTKPYYDMNQEMTTVYYHPIPIPNTWVFSPAFYPENKMNLADTSYVGWIDLNNRARFAHPTILFSYNPKTEEFKTQESSWYPVIYDNDKKMQFTDDNVLWGKSSSEIYSIGSKENTITEIATNSGEDTTCVLLVSGLDKKNPDQQKAFEDDIESVKNELTNEAMGLKLKEENIRVEKGIDKDSIISILESMKDKCDKVIFYYSGHGGTDGDMCTGDDSEDMTSTDDWTSYEELMDKLEEIGAKEYKIIIDACYSGKAKEEFDKHFDDSDATLITATDEEKEANTEAKGKSEKDAKRYALFTHYLLLCYGNKDADTNNDGIVSFEEAFNCVKKMKPKSAFGEDLDSLQKPSITTKKNAKIDETNSQAIFPDTDVTIAGLDGVEFNYDYKVSLSVADEDYTTNNKQIKKISGNRTWNITAEGISDGFSVDLLFQLRDQYEDLTPTGNDIIGMCWRENSNEDWNPQYPSIYNKDDKTVLCGQTDHLSEWVAAIILPQGVNNVENQYLINSVDYGPNPFKNLINFEFNLDNPEIFAIEIVDITGKVYDKIDERNYSKGNYTVNLDGSKYPVGTYYCRLVSTNNVRTIKLVKE